MHCEQSCTVLWSPCKRSAPERKATGAQAAVQAHCSPEIVPRALAVTWHGIGSKMCNWMCARARWDCQRGCGMLRRRWCSVAPATAWPQDSQLVCGHCMRAFCLHLRAFAGEPRVAEFPERRQQRSDAVATVPFDAPMRVWGVRGRSRRMLYCDCRSVGACSKKRACGLRHCALACPPVRAEARLLRCCLEQPPALALDLCY